MNEENIDYKNFPIVVHISNHHIHLTQQDFEVLFGVDAKLTKYKDLMQPGEFAANEKLTIVGPKGKIENVRIVGPLRKYTQIEISKTDSFILGVNPPVRDSGNIRGSSPITLIGPKGVLELKEGCIIALRHIHFYIEDAKKLCIENGDIVKIIVGKGRERETIFCNVLCRVSERYATECHLDTDEANAAMVKNNDVVYILEKYSKIV